MKNDVETKVMESPVRISVIYADGSEDDYGLDEAGDEIAASCDSGIMARSIRGLGKTGDEVCRFKMIFKVSLVERKHDHDTPDSKPDKIAVVYRNGRDDVYDVPSAADRIAAFCDRGLMPRRTAGLNAKDEVICHYNIRFKVRLERIV